MSSYMYLCMWMCVYVKVKWRKHKTMLLLLLWSEVKKRVWEKDKTKSTTLLSFQLNSTQHTSTSSQLTHLLTYSNRQTDRQTKKERKTCIALQQRQRHLYCSSTNTLLSFFPTQLHFSSTSTFPLLLKVNHFSLFSTLLNATQALVFLSNKDSCFVRLRCRLRLRCRVTESSSSQTNRQTERQTIKQRWEGDAEVKVETV